MMRNLLLPALLLAMFAVSCTGDGSDVRTLRIEASGGSCEPVDFAVDPGQRVRLVLENQDDAPYTLSDPEGRASELHVEPHDEAETFYTIPEGGGARYVLRCAGDGAETTEISLVVGGAGAETPTFAGATQQVGGPTLSPDEPDGTLAVSLADFVVSLSAETVPSGRFLFIATNVSAEQAHELRILQLQPDGSFQDEGGIPPMPPQQGGSVLANLRAGTYRIACMIQIGESGSTVDHYQQGMWADLVVE
jgi:hypothetical protein